MIKDFNALEISILKTIAYFDIFNYPLTVFEIYKWLYREDRIYQLSEIQTAIESKNLSELISAKFGMYFLSGRDDLVAVRGDRYQLAEKKFKIALRAARCFRWVAFVEMIAICNNVGYNNAINDSDIDFFIIIKKGRLWWSRFLITISATVLGVRRYGRKIKDRVCLSFYLADDSLDLTRISLKPDDIYLTYWLATLAPIFDQNIYQKFLAGNSWSQKEIPNFFPTLLSNRRRVKENFFSHFFKKTGEKFFSGVIGDFFERASKIFQEKKMRQHRLGHYPSGTEVVINDSMLKFHENDKRQNYLDLWRQRVKSLGLDL
ncbi:MAG: hypothetical protein WCX71_05205 [Candidatus Buchananbacteria bacterium]